MPARDAPCVSHKDVNNVKQYCLELFTEHPRNAGESYCQHFAYAFGTGLKLVGLGLVSAVHGLCPFLFTSTVSHYVPELADELAKRRAATHSNNHDDEDECDDCPQYTSVVSEVPVAQPTSELSSQVPASELPNEVPTSSSSNSDSSD